MLLFYCIFNLINVACVSLFSKTFLIIKKNIYVRRDPIPMDKDIFILF